MVGIEEGAVEKVSLDEPEDAEVVGPLVGGEEHCLGYGCNKNI